MIKVRKNSKNNHIETGANYSLQLMSDLTLVITFSGKIDLYTASYLQTRLISDLKSQDAEDVIINLNNIDMIDDYGLSILYDIEAFCDRRGKSFEILHLDATNQRKLDFFKSEINTLKHADKKDTKSNFFLVLGDTTLIFLREFKKSILFTGDIILSFLSLCIKPKTLRFKDTINYVQKTGVNAIFIVGLISFLLGLIMAFMSAIQLKQFGANIYVASLVGLSMARELGPIMTSIIVAGRSGSAFAAEIGTMKISEEVDALKIMGFDITLFLVMPRLIATVIALPILTLFSNFFANLGGLIVGTGMLGLTSHSYMHQLGATVALNDFLYGIVKSIIFALLIASVGCYRGLSVYGGTEEVGKATTSSVVSSIFLIILADSMMAVVSTYW